MQFLTSVVQIARVYLPLFRPHLHKVKRCFISFAVRIRGTVRLETARILTAQRCRREHCRISPIAGARARNIICTYHNITCILLHHSHMADMHNRACLFLVEKQRGIVRGSSILLRRIRITIDREINNHSHRLRDQCYEERNSYNVYTKRR